jgi:hypothetical protein
MEAIKSSFIAGLLLKLAELVFRYMPDCIARIGSPVSPQAILLADRFERDPQSNKRNLWGILNWFKAEEFPYQVSFFAFSDMVFRNPQRTNYEWRFKIVAPDGSDHTLGNWHSLEESATYPGCTAYYEFSNVIFNKPGKYQVVLEIKESKTFRTVSKTELLIQRKI